MSLPAGIATIIVTGENLCDLEGNSAASGTVYFIASGQLLDPTHGVVIADSQTSTPVVGGVMTPVVLPVNDETVNPNGFTVTVRQELFYGSSKTPVISDYPVSLPHTLGSTVDLSALAPASSFTPVNGISILGTGTAGEVLTNLGNQTADWQAPSGAGSLPTSGGTMTGPINMGSNKITNAANGTAGTDYATVGQLPAVPSPSSTVTAGTSFGQTSSAGSSAAFSKGDHGHGTPTLSNATTGVAGIVEYESNAAHLQPNGVAALGSNNLVVDSGHIHPMAPWQFLITAYGAVGDMKCAIDGAMNASAVLTCGTSNPFAPGDVGKPIVVKGALTSGQTSLVTTIASYQSASQVTLTVAATVANGTGLQVLWGTDNTAAIQSAINAAVAFESPYGVGSEIITPAAVGGAGYMIAGALKNTDGVNAIYNSQLTIGLNSGRNAGRVLSFSGVLDGGNTRYWDQDYPMLGSSTWFSTGVFSTQATQATSVTNFGNPSVLGGPTGKFGYGNSVADPVYNNFTVVLKDLVIMNTHSASGWTYCPFNFFGMARAHLNRCSFGTNGVVQYYKNEPGLGDFSSIPTFSGGISIGGLMPANGNNASNVIRDCVWNGGYTYGPLWTEHTVGEGVNTILYCWGGFCPVGVYGDSGSAIGALHAINFGQLAVESCSFHVMVFGPAATVHGILDTEGTVAFRDNPNTGTGLGGAVGEIRMCGSSNVPSFTSPTTLRVIREQILPGVNASPPALVANTAVCNTLYRTATVYLSGGANLTTVQVSSLAGSASAPAVATVADFTTAGTIATSFPVRVGPGQWIKVNTSTGTTLPSAVWVLD